LNHIGKSRGNITSPKERLVSLEWRELGENINMTGPCYVKCLVT